MTRKNPNGKRLDKDIWTLSRSMKSNLNVKRIMSSSSVYVNKQAVMRGDTLVIENKDSFIHTVTSGFEPKDHNIGKLFDTRIMKPGESAEVVVANLPPNEYPFFCTTGDRVGSSESQLEI